MSDKIQQDTLWSELKRLHAVMVGCDGGGAHHQPMAPHVDAHANTLWFFTDVATDLAQGATGGADAMVCVVGKDHDFHGCLTGTLTQIRSPQKINEYWSLAVSAWFDGKDDPALTMLEFKVREAMLWVSTDSAAKFGWEIAKANLTDSKPNVGHQQVIKFA